ncbi:MAG: DUF1059 domain-containing protein [Candidatus Doudnabacteria bacterium]
MKSLACADLGMPDDTFVAKGATDDEVMAMMMEHVKTAHPEKMTGDMEAMKAMLLSKIKTV